MTPALIYLDHKAFPIPAGIRDRMREIYRDLARDLLQNTLTCLGCGDCCHLEQWGHELWMTHLELYVLISEHGLRRPTPGGTCPYLREKRCDARTGRALGCRVFFCRDPHQQAERLYETYLNRIRELAGETGVDLYYGELLRSLGHVEYRP